MNKDWQAWGAIGIGRSGDPSGRRAGCAGGVASAVVLQCGLLAGWRRSITDLFDLEPDWMLQRQFYRSADVDEEMMGVEQKYHGGDPTNGSANGGSDADVFSG